MRGRGQLLLVRKTSIQLENARRSWFDSTAVVPTGSVRVGVGFSESRRLPAVDTSTRLLLRWRLSILFVAGLVSSTVSQDVAKSCQDTSTRRGYY